MSLANTQDPGMASGAYSDAENYSKIIQAYPSGEVYGNTSIFSVSMYRETQIDQKQELPVVNRPGGDALKGYSCGW